jgi:CRISPR-associated protein Cas1
MHIVLNSFGASIRQEEGLFSVSTAAGKQVLHPKDVESITISKSARISSDAVLLAIAHEIDVLFVDGVGNPQGRVWSVKYGSVSDIRRRQVEFMYSGKALDWIRDLIVEKINNQTAMLLSLRSSAEEPTVRRLASAINSLEDYKNKVRRAQGESLADLAPSFRGWEGAASRKYFQSLSECVPEGWKFSERSQHPASDPFNALLNYAYGMLYGKIEGALIKAGIDPYMGIFHRDDYNRPALVFDIIEKYRIWADYVVIQLARQDAMTEECFRTEANGAVLLDGLGKRILIQSMNDYLAEIIRLQGLERSRAEHIQQFAYKLANIFLDTVK